MKCAHKGVTV